MKFFDFNFDKLQKFLEKLTQVLLLVTSVSLLLGVLFGPDSAFIGAPIKAESGPNKTPKRSDTEVTSNRTWVSFSRNF